MGGIMHAARALWALDAPYVLAYVAPSYLDDQVARHAQALGAADVRKVGDVKGCPNVLIVGSPKEVGSQGYELLLRDEHRSEFDASALDDLCARHDASDTLILPGGFDLAGTLRVIGERGSRVYADVNHAPDDLAELGTLGRPLAACIVSTSSELFLRRCQGSSDELRSAVVGRYADSMLLKENRGGSRFFTSESVVQVDAHARRVEHSVGVGDCFDAVFIALRQTHGDRAALAYASYVAAEYGAVWDDDHFRRAARAAVAIPTAEMVEMRGLSLPWERRRGVQIYIAAPDFDGVDRRPLEWVLEALRYHNFTPRCPVRENGQVGVDATPGRRRDTFQKDMAILDECRMLLAVLLYDDPGTLIEIGIAAERGLPVLVYDPYRRATNLILTELPELVSSDLDEVLVNVFRVAAREGS
jgi:nucleoside 2-deoxyribosyltransferase